MNAPTVRLTGVLLMAMLLTGLIALSLPGTADALEVGDRAPDFSLPATTGEKISLSQFKGKRHVLLEFYGADFAPV